MKIDTLLGGKMISTYEYREGFIGSDAYKTYAPLKILGLGCIFLIKRYLVFQKANFKVICLYLTFTFQTHTLLL